MVRRRAATYPQPFEQRRGSDHQPAQRARLVARRLGRRGVELEWQSIVAWYFGDIDPSGLRIPARAGLFTGSELRGKLLPGASADWQTVLPDCTTLGDIRYTLWTDAGELLDVRSRGVRHGSAEVLTDPDHRLWSNRHRRHRCHFAMYIESYIVSYVTSPTMSPRIDREQLLDHVSSHLLQRASLVTRLLVRRSRHEFSRTEGGVLSTLIAGPRRITELAELEGLAQPSMTLLVRRLETRGWVKRDRQLDDGRVVVMSITEAGATALEEFRAEYRAVLRTHIEKLPDEQLTALENAAEALESLIDVLQSGSRA